MNNKQAKMLRKTTANREQAKAYLKLPKDWKGRIRAFVKADHEAYEASGKMAKHYTSFRHAVVESY